MSSEMTENEYRKLRDGDVIAYAGPRMKREFEQLTEDRDEWKRLAYETMGKVDALKAERTNMRESEKKLVVEFSEYKLRAEAERDTLRSRLQAEQQDYIGLKDAYERDTESLSNERDALKAENARLRAALEMYANPDSWVHGDYTDEIVWAGSPDPGNALAKDALEVKK